MAKKSQTPMDRYERTGRNPKLLVREIERTAAEKGIEISWRQGATSHRIVSTDLGSAPIKMNTNEIDKFVWIKLMKQLVKIGLGCLLLVAIITAIALA